jgi:integrase
MRGHLKERSPGHWAIVLDVRDPETGKRKRRWHSFRGTKRQAQDECARLIAEMNGGTYVDPSRITLAKYFEQWLTQMASQLSPRGFERYAELVRKNLVPALGAVHLTKLRPAQIADTYTKALASGRRDGKGGLSANTVVFMHRILKQALAQAVDWQIIARNPADLVKPPKTERRQMRVPKDGGAELVEAARGTPMFAPILLGVTTGMRRGEMAALRWRHIDLATGRLSVTESAEQTKVGIRYKPPKSGKGRIVSLSSLAVEELRAHRLRQAEELLRLGVRLGDDTFVVAREDGQPLGPRALTKAFKRFLAGHGLERIRLHDLRHTHATAMLKAGVHGKIVQERLGHASIAITLDIYSHVVDGLQQEAAERVDEALKIAMQKRRSEPIR